MTIKEIYLLFFIALLSFNLHASDLDRELLTGNRKDPFRLKYRSAIGPVLGFERGRYTFITIGFEGYQTKGLLKPRRITGGIEFAYNFKYNVVESKLYSFYKKGRLGLTYGGGLTYISDFNNSRFGLSPQIGYKLLNLHFYTGVNLMLGSKELQEYNKVFIGLNLFLPVRHNVFK